jgi:hypothetical protein
MSGVEGNDTIVGQDGTVVSMLGGEGDDHLFGFEDATMDGGDGFDTYYFAGANDPGVSIIDSFEPFSDTLVVMHPDDETPTMDDVSFVQTADGLHTLLNYEHPDGTVELLAQFNSSDMFFGAQEDEGFSIQFVPISTFQHLQL